MLFQGVVKWCLNSLHVRNSGNLFETLMPNTLCESNNGFMEAESVEWFC